MNISLENVSSFSICLPAAIVVARYKKIHRDYKPFLFIILLALVTEAVNYMVIRSGFSNAIPLNIYSLCDYFLWLWQFRRWGAFRTRPRSQAVLITMAIAIALVQTVHYQSSSAFNSAQNIFSSFSVVFLATNQINLLIVEARQSLLKNAKFLICTGVVIFYTYNIMVNSFYWFNISQSIEFWVNVRLIVVYANIVMNLIFAYAVLRLPSRRRSYFTSSLLYY